VAFWISRYQSAASSHAAGFAPSARPATLLNAAIGLAEKIAGPHFGVLLLSFQFLLGLSAIISFYVLLTRLRVAPLFSLCLSFVLLLNPAEVYFKFPSLYTSRVLAFHCLIALAIVCYVQSRSQRALYWLVGLAVLLTCSALPINGSGSSPCLACCGGSCPATGSRVVNLVDVGENRRFRFETEALVLAVAAIFLQQLRDRRRTGRKEAR